MIPLLKEIRHVCVISTTGTMASSHSEGLSFVCSLRRVQCPLLAQKRTYQSLSAMSAFRAKWVLILVQKKLKLRNGTPQSSSSSVRSSAAFLTSFNHCIFERY